MGSIKKKSRFVKIFIALFALFFSANAFAQTDTEFWFSIPEFNRYHQSGTVANPCNDGTPTRLRITTLKDPATVTISMPANGAFVPMNLNLPANHTEVVDLYSRISDLVVSSASSMENRLLWTSSSTAVANPYINKNNKGLLIQSDNYITVYYEIGAINNKDLLTLKGRNALGERFVVPFQTDAEISNGYNYTLRPYGSFDIVATHDNTHVRIKVPQQIFVFNDAGGKTFLNAGTHDIWLNRGETAIIAPYDGSKAGLYKTSNANKLAGSTVTVIQNDASTTKKVAVLTKEDMVSSPGSVDYVADQLVPVNHLGTAYAVIKGYAQNNATSLTYEHFYIVGTAVATNVQVVFSDGVTTVGAPLNYILNEGQSQSVTIPFNATVATVKSDVGKPVAIFHQSGVGTQFAGAIIPTISVCTGSSSVAFNRTMAANTQACPLNPGTTSTGHFDFYLNILVYNGAETGFRLLKNGVDVTAAELPQLLAANAPTHFKPLPGGVAPFNTYKFARIKADNILKNEAYTLVNDINVFHLGIINGAGNGVSATNADAFYGYFSDFNEFVAQASVGNSVSTILPICYGSSTKLDARGGTTYQWSPTDFLDNPNIADPNVISPIVTTKYTVTVGGACSLTSTAEVTVDVSPHVNPILTSSAVHTCGNASVTFTADNLSGITKLRWYIKKEGGVATLIGTNELTNIDPVPLSHTFNYDGNGVDPVVYTVRLEASNVSCEKILENTIRVYPAVDVNPVVSLDNSNGCSPLTVTFTAGGTAAAGAYYRWEFGDGSTSSQQNPVKTFYNYDHTAAKTFANTVTVTDKYNVCSHTLNANVIVQPLVDASFSINPVESCSPRLFKAVSDSKVPAGTPFKWYVDNVLSTNTSSTLNYPSTHSGIGSAVETHKIKLVLEANSCKDSLEKEVKVYPTPVIGTIAFAPNTGFDAKCSPLDLKFTATGLKNGTVYYWQVRKLTAGTSPVYIVDGGAITPTTTTLELASYLFTNFTDATENYEVKLVLVNDDFGCETSKTVNVKVNPYVQAIVATDFSEGCPNADGDLTVEFLDASIVPTTATMKWYIDGTQINPTDPKSFTHTFTNTSSSTPKTYTVTLEVSNVQGCVSSDMVDIIVYPRVTADFNAIRTDTNQPLNEVTNYCSPVPAKFTGVYQNATNFLWDFNGMGSAITSEANFDLVNGSSVLVNYLVTFKASNSYGCYAQAQKTYKVYPGVSSEISLSQKEGCVPFDITAYAKPSTSAIYEWFWDGVSQGFGNSYSFPTVNANKTGADVTHTIKLVASPVGGGGIGCAGGESSVVVKVYPEVQAKWSGSTAPFCSSGTLNLTNTSNLYKPALPVSAAYWEVFNPANVLVHSSNQPAISPVLETSTFETPEVYKVRLTATSDKGCVGTHETSVTVNPKVEAAFTSEILDRCTPLKLKLTNTSRAKSGPTTIYTWGYNGGVETPAGSGVFVYTAPGNKNVTLTVRNEYGCEDVATPFTFTVEPQVVPSIGTAVSPSARVCAPEDLTFTNGSTGATKFTWDFGDGTTLFATSTSPVTHRFENRTAAVIQRNVTLTAQNDLGCSVSTSGAAIIPVWIYPEIEPISNFKITDYCNPLKGQLENKSLNGTSFTWTITPSSSDGTAQSITIATPTDKPNISLVNNSANADVTYTIGFNAKSDWTSAGGSVCSFDAPTETVTVAPKLVSDFSLNAAVFCSGEELVIADNSTGGNVTHAWLFGDGQSASSLRGQPVKHTYNNASDADLTPVITVTSTQPNVPTGCPVTKTFPVRVHPQVVGGFTYSVPNVCAYPLNINFTNSTTGSKAATGVTSTYAWDYGYVWGGTPQKDDRTTTAPHSYAFYNAHTDNDAVYTISLLAQQTHSVSGKVCGSLPVTKTITVSPELLPAFTPDDAYGCSDHTTTFTNSTTGGLNMNYYWDFGNTESATTVGTATKPAQTFVYRGSADSTVYTIGLRATNKHGCQKSTTREVTVYPKIEAEFGYVSDSVCTPYYVVVTNNSLNGKRFNWDFGHSVAGTLRDTTTLKSANSFRFLMDNEAPNDIKNYTIKLIASHQHLHELCSDTITRPIQVYPRLITEFALDDKEGCNPLPVRFTNQSTGLGTYVWNLGDGGTSTSATTISKEYKHGDRENVVKFPVLLTSTNVNGCKSAKRDTVTVYPLVKANYQVSQINGCTPLQVNVTNTSPSSAYSYLWEYGDGRATTSLVNPGDAGLVEYKNTTQNTPQILQPRLKLTTRYVGDNTCVDTTSKVFTVYPHIYPSFTADLEGCHPHDVSFANQTDAFSANTTYLWDFGNSVTSNSLSPDFRFINESKTQDKTYDIWLKAISEHGCADSTMQVVRVHPRPKAVMDVVGKFIDCPPFDVQVRNRSLGTNLTNTYSFGDGTANVVSANPLVTHRFNNPNSTTEPYVVNLHVNSEFGCDDNTSQTVYVYPKVTASYQINPQLADCSPFMVTMTNQTSNALYYSWDFGNGLTSVNENPFHRFTNTTANNQTFDIRLYAESEFECNDDTVQTITVYATPIPDFVIDPPLKIYPDATFGITNQTKPANASWTYSWNYGDGYFEDRPLSPLSFNKTYSKWGPKDKEFQYTIKLDVTTPHCPRTISRNLTLLPAEPITTFDVDTEADCSPLEASFTNLSQYGSTFFWDFGDGTTSTEEEPVHVFTEPGFYNVKLTVTGDGGVTHFYKTLQVYRNPVAKFQVAPKRAMLPNAEVRFFNLTEFGHKYAWDFGDGTGISYDESPLHIYTKLGEYRVTLTAESENGCVDVYSEFPAVWVEGAGYLEFPNAFVPSLNGPNGGTYDEVDYKNEVFHPVHDGVIEYQLLVFNRWGEQVFESKDVNVGWDGYRDGKICEQGVYVWRAKGKFTNGRLFNIRGNVTLLR